MDLVKVLSEQQLNNVITLLTWTFLLMEIFF